MADRGDWCAVIRADLSREAVERPSPQAVSELADALLGGRPRSDLSSAWARNMLDEAPRRDQWRDGYATALLAAAEQATAIMMDVKGDQAPGWDELFRDDLGGPDLRIVDKEE